MRNMNKITNTPHSFNSDFSLLPSFLPHFPTSQPRTGQDYSRTLARINQCEEEAHRERERERAEEKGCERFERILRILNLIKSKKNGLRVRLPLQSRPDR